MFQVNSIRTSGRINPRGNYKSRINFLPSPFCPIAIQIYSEGQYLETAFYSDELGYYPYCKRTSQDVYLNYPSDIIADRGTPLSSTDSIKDRKQNVLDIFLNGKSNYPEEIEKVPFHIICNIVEETINQMRYREEFGMKQEAIRISLNYR